MTEVLSYRQPSTSPEYAHWMLRGHVNSEMHPLWVSVCRSLGLDGDGTKCCSPSTENFRAVRCEAGFKWPKMMKSVMPDTMRCSGRSAAGIERSITWPTWSARKTSRRLTNRPCMDGRMALAWPGITIITDIRHHNHHHNHDESHSHNHEHHHNYGHHSSNKHSNGSCCKQEFRVLTSSCLHPMPFT